MHGTITKIKYSVSNTILFKDTNLSKQNVCARSLVHRSLTFHIIAIAKFVNKQPQGQSLPYVCAAGLGAHANDVKHTYEGPIS